MTPLFEPEPGGGQVVVTRFECGSLLSLLTILALHLRMKFDVRRQTWGFIGIKLLVDWRRRTILSISLWDDLDGVYSMGSVRRHIAATRLPGSLGVETTCGVFCYVGDWRRVMYRHAAESRSPLKPLDPTSDSTS